MLDAATRARCARRALIIKALAHPLRVALVEFLGEDERCVGEIADYLGAERSNVSRHLAVMQKSGALSCRKDGLQVYYRVRTPCILKFLECAAQVLSHNVGEDLRALDAPAAAVHRSPRPSPAKGYSHV